MAEENDTKNTNITALTFTLSSEMFAMDIGYVKEVLEYSKITKVPKTPDYMLGVINLRGSVAPVVDLKMKFNMPQSERTVDTCIIIVEVEIENSKTIVGILADSVKEVFDFDSSSIEATPTIGLNINVDFIHGIAKHKDDFVMILDINKVFSIEEINAIGKSKDMPEAKNEDK
ncbi:MAG: chemotaxis protein CheW [Thermoplasmata archaeon]